MMQIVSQLLSAALGSISFGLIFNLNRRYLPAAEHFGEQTFLAALGIAGGMAIAWCLADLSRKLRGRL